MANRGDEQRGEEMEKKKVLIKGAIMGFGSPS